jgi:general secretion pathway protein G
METIVRMKRSRVQRFNRQGFTLVELLIVVVILGILAGIVIAGFSNTSTEAKENMLKENLRVMRTQIGAYRAQHTDVSPGYANGDDEGVPSEADFFAQMLEKTNIYGDTTAATTNFGPYMRAWPENPINKKSAVLILGNDEEVPSEAAEGDYGWLFKPSEVIFKAYCVGADASGKSYLDY